MDKVDISWGVLWVWFSNVFGWVIDLVEGKFLILIDLLSLIFFGVIVWEYGLILGVVFVWVVKFWEFRVVRVKMIVLEIFIFCWFIYILYGID